MARIRELGRERRKGGKKGRWEIINLVSVIERREGSKYEERREGSN